MTVYNETSSIGAGNTFSFPARIHGHFNVSISGTWEGTIWLQRQLSGQSSFNDYMAFTDNTEMVLFEPEVGTLYRAGFKTDDWVEGTAVVRISQ